MATLFVATHPDDLAAIPWAQRIASKQGRSLTVLCGVTDTTSQTYEVSSASARDDQSDLVTATLEALEASGADGVKAIECRGSKLGRAVLNWIADAEVHEVILCAPIADRHDPRINFARSVFRACAMDVILLNVDASTSEAPSRILVPQFLGGGGNALAWAVRGLGSDTTNVIAFPDPRHASRSRRVFTRAQERSPESKKALLTQHDAPHKSISVALQNSIAENDLILFDAEQTHRAKALLGPLRELRRTLSDRTFSLAIVRPAGVAAPGRIDRAIERTRKYIPTLSRDERKDLHDHIERGGRVSTDFVVMITLSAAIAALGLIQSSAAVVIGAMLVAPLMTPLVAMGMALVQANIKLFRDALRAMIIGVVGALVVSFLIGSLSPWDDLSAEVVARGSPNLFDMGIALLSGVAASYALARPGLTGTLVGVAIAVALVPPLAAIGIALAQAEYRVAIGATVLFTTNFLAITLGAALVFQFFGLRVRQRDGGVPRWVRGVVAMLVLGTLTTLAPLFHNLVAQTHLGVQRPYSRPLPPALRNAIRAVVEATPNVEILMMAHSDIEHGFGVEVALLCSGTVDPELTEQIQSLVALEMGSAMPSRVLLLQGAVGSDHEPDRSGSAESAPLK